MSLGAFNEIGVGKNFPPLSDGGRQRAIVSNRQLYRGQWTQLGVADEYNPDKREYPVRFNLFRRIPQFYAELMFGAPPTITARGRGQAFVDAMYSQLISAYSRAFVDMLRYGAGIPLVHPRSGAIMSVQPDSWFSVSDGAEIVGDIAAWVANAVTGETRLDGLGDTVPTNNSRTLHAIFLPTDGELSVRSFEFNGGRIGSSLADEKFGGVGARLVAPCFHGYAFNEDGVSIYDDFKENVGEIARRMTGLSATLTRNQRPHMFVDSSSIKSDGAKPTVNVEGEMFAVPSGGVIPGYIQYDSRLQSVKYDIEQNFNFALMAAGISPLIFTIDPGRAGAVLSSDSGRAIRRLLLPTFARLGQYKRVLEDSMRALIPASAAVFAARGGEQVEISPMDIGFSWQYEEIFGDGDQNPDR